MSKRAEPQYLTLLAKLVKQAAAGKPEPDRTNTGIYSRFGDTIKFDTTNQRGELTVPLLTSKYVAWEFVVSELCWFLSGSTNVNDLPAKWQHLWRPWANADGSLGETYGYQLRSGVDPLMTLLRGLMEHPESRRHVLSLWANQDIAKCKLPPCHGTVIQFHVDGHTLHMLTHQRSADIFLGVPYNLASYTLLLHIVANILGLKSGRITYHFGNLHLYANHVSAAKEQLVQATSWMPSMLRATYSLKPEPTLSMRQLRFDDLYLDDYRLNSSCFELTGYDPATTITAPLAV